MPKVPDLDMSEGSIASGGQTSFGADRQLWTPDKDKKPPSLVEQRVMEVAKQTRMAGMLDWLPGFGPRGGEAKPTPEPGPKPINYGAAKPMGEYPSDEAAEFAKSSGIGYGSVHEPYINNQTAKVYGEVRTNVTPGAKGKPGKSESRFVASTPAGQTISSLLDAVNDRTKSTDIDLTKPEFKDVRDRIGLAYTKAAMAVEANPIAKLGYDPKIVMSDVSGQKTNLSGAYRRPQLDKEGKEIQGTEGIYANLTDPSVLVHESIHRGVKLLEQNPEAVKLMNTLPSSAGGHEMLVRYMMVKHAGDPEKLGPSGREDEQRKRAIGIFEDKYWGKQHQATIDKLMDIAAEEVRKKRPGGPR